MNPHTSKPGPERGNTDDSLRVERKNTDEALDDGRTRTEQDTNKLVEGAREHADAVVASSRHEANVNLQRDGVEVQVHQDLATERAREDEILDDQRAVADAHLSREREDQTRSLASLLAHEREKTDRHLLAERGRSDHAVTHRDDFMGMVSHDLRNLLNGIAGEARLLSVKASPSEEGQRTMDAMKRVQRYVARMNRLIGDLVDIVSIDAGKLAVHPERGDAAMLIKEAVSASAHAAAEKGISLQSETVDESSLVADYDRDRMLQVLANLITNAIKFTHRGGQVTVCGARTGEDLQFCVRDTGTGIPSHMLEAVFERFWQVGGNDQRGMGLGLYISKCIVDAHRGRIWAESTLGIGSAFYFTIPITAASNA